MSRSTGMGRNPPSRRTHGHSFVNGRATTEYRIWSNMKHRCSNARCKNYHLYGGRGITVCDEWQKFEGFLSDMGARPSNQHSLDRINNDGNYEPSNVRWATRTEQARNSRNVRLVSFEGEMVALSVLVERLGLHLPKVRQRLNRGWTLEEALT